MITVAITPATLTFSEAAEYVRKRGFLEDVLIRQLGLQPLYIGPGTGTNRTKLYSRERIDQLLAQLELQGGLDANTGKSVQPFPPSDTEN